MRSLKLTEICRRIPKRYLVAFFFAKKLVWVGVALYAANGIAG